MNNKIIKGISIVVIILLFVPQIVRSQDLNNLFSPYGFKAPFLKSGEFIINTTGTFLKYDEDTHNDEQNGFSDGYNYKYSYLGVSGILALCDKFLIGPGLYLIPESEQQFYQKGTDYLYDVSWSSDTYFQPYFRFVYRPKNTVEISGYISRYKYNEKEKTTFNNEDYGSGNSDGNQTRLELNINYYGLVFNK